jgi:hypothetical protein
MHAPALQKMPRIDWAKCTPYRNEPTAAAWAYGLDKASKDHHICRI